MRLTQTLVGLITVIVMAGNCVWAGDGFWDKKEEGWFFYDDPALVPEKEEPEKEPEPIIVQSEPEEPKGPEPLSAKWFRENLSVYRDKALDKPTAENVQMYMYLQRAMMDKADTFSQVAQQVVVTDPLLDENSRSPRASFAAIDNRRQAFQEKEAVVRLIAQRAGLYFFFASHCPYCHKQAPVLSSMEKTYGLKIAPVSIDHKPMPGNLYTNFVPDSGQAKALGVVSTPALYLVQPGKSVVPLVQGAISESELLDRIVLAAKTANIISEAEYKRTTAAGDAPLLALGGQGDGATAISSLSEETLNDPKAFIERMRSELRKQQ
jgi:conjugal transfer pilus assembly protein TraF